MASVLVSVSIAFLFHYDQMRKEKSMNKQAFSEKIIDTRVRKKFTIGTLNRSIYFLQGNKEHDDLNRDQANYGKTSAYLYKTKYDFQSTSVKKKRNRCPKHIL